MRLEPMNFPLVHSPAEPWCLASADTLWNCYVFDEWPSTTLFITLQRTECESAIKDYNNMGTSTTVCDWGKSGASGGLT